MSNWFKNSIFDSKVPGLFRRVRSRTFCLKRLIVFFGSPRLPSWK